MKRPKIKIKYILIGLGVFLLLAQFVKIDKNNPAIVQGEDFITLESPDAEVSQLLTVACYDCHSHSTAYPWYTDVAPISWWVKRHINIGRQKLNFATWGQYSEKKQQHKVEECVEYTEKGWMPIGSYKLMHPEARLSDSDREKLVTYFKGLQN